MEPGGKGRMNSKSHFLSSFPTLKVLILFVTATDMLENLGILQLKEFEK